MSAPNGYHLTYSDEFNGSSWSSEGWNTSYAQWGGLRTLSANKEQQIYVDSGFTGSGSTPLGLNPFSESNGVMSITAKPTPAEDRGALWNMPYVSGVLTSKHAQTYGYFEVSAKLPVGKGLWPGFWMVGDVNHGNTEIDIFEVLSQEPGRIYQSAHKFGTDYKSTHESYYGVNTADGFHTYGLEWTPSDIIWSVDGVQTLKIANFSDVPMYAILNLPVGGSWGGNPDGSTKFPASLQVDYYRAYTKDAGSVSDVKYGTSGSDTFQINNPTTQVVENASGLSGGYDIVQSSVSYALPANVESLRLTGSSAINATGSSHSDELWGNDGANVLRGLDGDDMLTGGRGADTLIGGAGADTFFLTDEASSPAGGHDSLWGDGSVPAFENPGSARGDLIDFSKVDANSLISGNQAFTWGTSQGTGHLWAVQSGTETIIRGNTDADSAAEIEVAIADGSVSHTAYNQADFIL